MSKRKRGADPHGDLRFARQHGKDACRYGVGCYRENADHWENYDHPDEHPFLSGSVHPSAKQQKVLEKEAYDRCRKVICELRGTGAKTLSVEDAFARSASQRPWLCNYLVELPDEVCELSDLEELELGYCAVSMLPDGIDKLTKLIRIGDHRTQWALQPEGLRLPSAFGNLASLEAFQTQASIGWKPEQALEAFRRFREVRKLKSINLWYGSWFEDDTVKAALGQLEADRGISISVTVGTNGESYVWDDASQTWTGN